MQRKDGPEVPVGCFLGDWVDEIEKDYGKDAKIIEYVSTGAKSYSYKVCKPDGKGLFTYYDSVYQPQTLSLGARRRLVTWTIICEHPQKMSTVVKSKGFTLDSETSDILHLTQMKNMVIDFAFGDVIEKLELKTEGIRRTKEHEIVTRQLVKSFNVTADKRWLGSNFELFPYGWLWAIGWSLAGISMYPPMWHKKSYQICKRPFTEYTR